MPQEASNTQGDAPSVVGTQDPPKDDPKGPQTRERTQVFAQGSRRPRRGRAKRRAYECLFDRPGVDPVSAPGHGELSEAPPRHPVVYTLIELQCNPEVPAALPSQLLQLPQAPARDPRLCDYAEAGACPRGGHDQWAEGGAEA